MWPSAYASLTIRPLLPPFKGERNEDIASGLKGLHVGFVTHTEETKMAYFYPDSIDPV